MLATSTAEQYSFISFKLQLPTKLAPDGTLRKKIQTFIIRKVHKIKFIKCIYDFNTDIINFLINHKTNSSLSSNVCL